MYRKRCLPTRSCLLLLYWTRKILMSYPENKHCCRGWGRTRKQWLPWDHMESAATLCCLTNSWQCSLQDLISLLQLLSSSAQSQWGCRAGLLSIWADSTPCLALAASSTPTQAMLEAVATNPELHSLQQWTQMQEVREMWQRHSRLTLPGSASHSSTWACKISSADHSIEIMLATLIQIDCLSPTQTAPFEGNANVCTFERNVTLP